MRLEGIGWYPLIGYDMSKFLLDELKKEEWATFIYGGFDPDLHNSAYVRLMQKESTYGNKQILNVAAYEFSIKKKYKGFDAVQRMVEEIQVRAEEAPGIFDCNKIIIEGQRLYPEKDATRQKMVGKANNLMSLAYLSGALHALAVQSCLYQVDLVQPQAWKGQKKKEPMHHRAKEILSQSSLGHVCEGLTIHQMDALCMALVAGGHKV